MHFFEAFLLLLLDVYTTSKYKTEIACAHCESVSAI